MLRLANSARSLHDLSSQSSLYIPLSIPPILPNYIQLDRIVEWHTSALLSLAFESTTLPSRLRSGVQNRGSLSDMNAAINVNGNQRIAQLACAVVDPGLLAAKSTAQTRAKNDPRVPSDVQSRLPVSEHEEGQSKTGYLDPDIDLSGGTFTSLANQSRHTKKSKDYHVFGATACHRGPRDIMNDDENEEEDGYEGEEIGQARKRARFSGGPIVERYDTPLPYPLPTSFPPIFPSRMALQGSSGTTAAAKSSSSGSSSPSSSSLAVRTALATSTRLRARITDLQALVAGSGGGRGRGPGLVPVEDREALANGLGEIAEAYVEGWESGGEESDEGDF